MGLVPPTPTFPSFVIWFMMNQGNLSHMMISGWKKKYSDILKQFKYSEEKDKESAGIFSWILSGYIFKITAA